MPTKTVEFIGRLEIGSQGDGKVVSSLETEAQLNEFGRQLQTHTKELTVINTADCMEDRRNLRFANGLHDPQQLRERIAPQFPGGLVLACTKAALAANAAFLRDAKDMIDAYLKTYQLLTDLGYEDGGHASCGAASLVQKSVAEPTEMQLLIPTVGTILKLNQSRSDMVVTNTTHMQHLLQDGFFDSWSGAWHESFLQQHAPQNTAFIEVDPNHPAHGHKADGILLIDDEGLGFEKNGLIEDTGRLAFGITLAPMSNLAQKLGGTPEERDRILVGFAMDIPNVSRHIIAPGMPAFKI